MMRQGCRQHLSSPGVNALMEKTVLLKYYDIIDIGNQRVSDYLCLGESGI